MKNTINGISANQKSGFWFIFVFGSIFFLIGGYGFIAALPKIISDGEYGGLSALVFLVIGGCLVAFALFTQRRYKIIGPSPLFLDPLPGVIGGQVGGKFDVAVSSNGAPITMTLTCRRRVKSGKKTRTKIVWQESTQAYVEETANGMRVRFLFDCPDHLPDSTSRSIIWEVSAESTVKVQSNPIKLERTWDIPVEKTQGMASSIGIPEQFIQQQEAQKTQAAKTDAAKLVNFNQQGRFLEVESLGERSVGACIGGILFGLIFAGAGALTIKQTWWFGFIFLAIGALLTYLAVFILGRAVEIKVDTSARILHMRRSWFGFVLYQRDVMLFDPSQFSIKETSSAQGQKRLTQYFKVQVKDKEKQVLVAEGIKGRDVAEALMNGIIEKAFPMRY